MLCVRVLFTSVLCAVYKCVVCTCVVCTCAVDSEIESLATSIYSTARVTCGMRDVRPDKTFPTCCSLISSNVIVSAIPLPDTSGTLLHNVQVPNSSVINSLFHSELEEEFRPSTTCATSITHRAIANKALFQHIVETLYSTLSATYEPFSGYVSIPQVEQRTKPFILNKSLLSSRNKSCLTPGSLLLCR